MTLPAELDGACDHSDRADHLALEQATNERIEKRAVRVPFRRASASSAPPRRWHGFTQPCGPTPSTKAFVGIPRISCVRGYPRLIVLGDWRDFHALRLCKSPRVWPPRSPIHLSTLAKLLSADVWVVLDDVQFCRRDYQHRARLAALHDPAQQQWLSLNVHLPHGRSTAIRDAVLVDARRCQRRVEGMLNQYFARSDHWPTLSLTLRPVVERIANTGRVHEIAELSTRVLLDACGWQGAVVRSSDLQARSDRSARLADLARAVGADTYLCGRGGARYLDTAPFDELGIAIEYFQQPGWLEPAVWQTGQRVSAAWAVAKYGIPVIRPHSPNMRGAA